MYVALSIIQHHNYAFQEYVHCTTVACYTVEPLKKGHFGNGTFVLSSEVVLVSKVHENEVKIL